MGTEPTIRGLLRCDHCGRVEICSTDQVYRYSIKGWPQCCNVVMSFFVEMAPLKTDMPESLADQPLAHQT